MLQEVQPGDAVRIDNERQLWRVEGKTRKGLLTLEALNAHPRIRWDGVHEFRAVKVEAFA